MSFLQDFLRLENVWGWFQLYHEDKIDSICEIIDFQPDGLVPRGYLSECQEVCGKLIRLTSKFLQQAWLS